MMKDYAMFFAPSLSEQSDRKERKVVDVWRRMILQKLAAMPEEKSKVLWDMMRQWLEQQFIHYETSDGGDEEKRKLRVDRVVDEKIQQRFPEDAAKQKRAKSFIAAKRESFHYPDLEQMKKAYKI
jgi:hypothetical protein